MKKKTMWILTINWLKREFPPRRKTYVRTASAERDAGYTALNNNKFIVIVSGDFNFNTRMDTLLHEWAHCLTWFGAEDTTVHPGEWGLSHAKILRAFEKWNYGQPGELP